MFNNNDFNAAAFGSALQGFGTAGQALLRLVRCSGNNTPPPLPELPNFSSRLGTVGGGFTQNIPGMPNNFANFKLPNL